MFPMDGVVTDIQYTYPYDDAHDHANTTFILNGKELVLTTFNVTATKPPFIVPSHLILAVERRHDNSLRVEACYIKDKGIYVDFDKSGTLICSLLMAIIFTSIFIMTVINLKDYILALEFIVGSIALLLSLLSLYWGFWTFFKHSKGRKIIAYRLHRIIQLEKTSKLTPCISAVK